ncbi:MAG TPA: PAS domain S-box protein [Candidatus Acidoferrales bacterium]|nr:PAS domain S-box protein [Candidatus Acidoferrales bacterium]
MSQSSKPIAFDAMSLEELAESEHRHRKLVESLPDAIIVHTEGRIVYANPFALRLHKATGADELLGREISDFIDPQCLGLIKQRIVECHATGIASSPAEVVLNACDGSSVDVESVAIPISWNGAPAIEVVLRDITQRKRAEEAAITWQKRLELAQKGGLKIGLWDWDLARNTVKWSDESYQQFGFSRETFSGHVDEALTRLHRDDRERMANLIARVLKGEVEEYAAQYRLSHPDDTVRWIDAHGVKIRNGSEHMIGIGIDITDIKHTEQSLKESEESYSLLLNSTAEAIYGLDRSGHCTFCNAACVRLLGYEASTDLLGKNMHALMHHTRPNGSEYLDRECSIYVAVREGRANHLASEVFWRADGTSFPAEYWSYPMYKDGEVVGAVVTFLDISERKRAEEELEKSEEKYRKLFENAMYGVFLAKPDGTLLDVNPAMVDMLGYASKEELLSKNLERDIYENPAERKQILEKATPDKRVEGIEVNWIRKDGKTIPVRISGAVILTGDGDALHEVIVENVAESKKLEQQYLQSQKMEVVGLLAGGISHDFNNLLGVVLGSADLLLDDAAPNQQRHLEAIKKAGQSAAHLIRQLLAFSRKQVLHPALLNLNGVVIDVGKMLQRIIGEDVRIVTDLDTGIGAIRADRGQIEQILLNLATNARDAMPNGGTFTVRTQNAELSQDDVSRYAYIQPGAYVRLRVSDTGVGMSEEVRTRIFEPFFTTKEKGRGTGLGLATVYGIVKQSGGYIWASSEIGSGTTFDIYLPRLQEEVPEETRDLQPRGEYPRGTETILLLEDEDSLRQVMCEFLMASGYNVLQANRAEIAADLATQYKGAIPLIISDVVLPEISGPKAVSKLKRLHPEMQALFVSGYAEVPVAQQLIAEGAVLLQKPVSRIDLLEKVDEILHSKLSNV